MDVAQKKKKKEKTPTQKMCREDWTVEYSKCRCVKVYGFQMVKKRAAAAAVSRPAAATSRRAGSHRSRVTSASRIRNGSSTTRSGCSGESRRGSG